jgi:deoxycytidylate deaminase
MGSASTKGSTMYTLYTPCIHCAKYIVTAGITRVVYAQVYRNSTVLEYFKTAGVETEEYAPTAQWNEEVIGLFQKAVEEKHAPEITLSVE